MYYKYVNGCVMRSLSGLPFTFEPFIFCDVGTWHDLLSDHHFYISDFERGVYQYVRDDDLDEDLDDDPDDDPYYEPFDYDFDF